MPCYTGNKVKLADSFFLQVGDQLSLSVTGVDGESGITTRTEVPVFLEEPIEDEDQLSIEAAPVTTTSKPLSTTTTTVGQSGTNSTTSESVPSSTKSTTATTTTKGGPPVSDKPLEQQTAPDSGSEPADQEESEKTEEEIAAERLRTLFIILFFNTNTRLGTFT
jgi:hypothetical protein